MFNLIVKVSAEEDAFLESVRAAMEEYFGEDQLLIKCKIPENCTEEEHRLNRRTELQLFY